MSDGEADKQETESKKTRDGGALSARQRWRKGGEDAGTVEEVWARLEVMGGSFG